MSDRQVRFLDLGPIFNSIGEKALRSMRDWCVETADLSERLCLAENKNVTNWGHLPECYFKDLLLKIYSPHDHVTWGAIFPRFDQLVTLNRDTSFEVGDLLMATTILSPLIEKIGAGSTAGPLSDFQNDPTNEVLTRLVLFWGQKCALTLDSATRSLVPSMAYVASKLGLKIDRAKKRKMEYPPSGALDPAIRIRYEIPRHVPQDKILDRLRRSITPLYDLSDVVGEQPCVFWGQNGPQHAKLTRACEVMTPFFEDLEYQTFAQITDQNEVAIHRW